MQSILKDPMFSDIDLPALEFGDLAISYPGMTEAFLRLYTAYREEQLALADRAPLVKGAGPAWRRENPTRSIPWPKPAGFSLPPQLFPNLDDAAEHLARPSDQDEFIEHCASSQPSVRSVRPGCHGRFVRRLDLHRGELLLEDSLDNASLISSWPISLPILKWEG